MFALRDFAAFKSHMRDFLVQVGCARPRGAGQGARTRGQGAAPLALLLVTPLAQSFSILNPPPPQTAQFADQNNADLFAEEVAAQVRLCVVGGGGGCGAVSRLNLPPPVRAQSQAERERLAAIPGMLNAGGGDMEDAPSD